MAQPQVFVSHSHKDDDFTQWLVDDLHRAGAEVWVDKAGILHGNFMERIDEALAQCEWMVLVLTPNALSSPYVKVEVYAALRRVRLGYMRDVIPVQAAPCDEGTIPPQWGVLHRYDATRDYQAAVASLLRALELPVLEIAASSPAPTPNVREPEPSGQPPVTIPSYPSSVQSAATEDLWGKLSDASGIPALRVGVPIGVILGAVLVLLDVLTKLWAPAPSGPLPTSIGLATIATLVLMFGVPLVVGFVARRQSGVFGEGLLAGCLCNAVALSVLGIWVGAVRVEPRGDVGLGVAVGFTFAIVGAGGGALLGWLGEWLGSLGRD